MIETTVYVLGTSRAAADVDGLLRQFLPSRRLITEDLVVPQGSDTPLQSFANPSELMNYLERCGDVQYELIWKAAVDTPSTRQVIASYLGDGGLLYGFVVALEDSESILAQAVGATHSAWGVVLGNQAPPDSVVEFMELCSSADAGSVVAGQFRARAE